MTAESRVPQGRWAVDEIDIVGFACNADVTEGHVFEPHVAPLGEFMKADGGARCPTLRLDPWDHP